MIKPQLFYYPLAGIQSIESLAKHLDIDLDKLTYLLENINSQYIGPIFKKNPMVAHDQFINVGHN